MLGVVLLCYGVAIFVAVLVMIIPPRLTYRYDNGYYSCIGHFVNTRWEIFLDRDYDL